MKTKTRKSDAIILVTLPLFIAYLIYNRQLLTPEQHSDSALYSVVIVMFSAFFLFMASAVLEQRMSESKYIKFIEKIPAVLFFILSIAVPVYSIYVMKCKLASDNISGIVMCIVIAVIFSLPLIGLLAIEIFMLYKAFLSRKRVPKEIINNNDDTITVDGITYPIYNFGGEIIGEYYHVLKFEMDKLPDSVGLCNISTVCQSEFNGKPMVCKEKNVFYYLDNDGNPYRVGKSSDGRNLQRLDLCRGEFLLLEYGCSYDLLEMAKDLF